MDYYTNVALVGNTIFYRGFQNNKKILKKVSYSPSLFLPDDSGKYSTIRGKKLSKKKFKNVSKAREFTRTYSDVEGFEYYGYEKYAYCYLWEQFPQRIEYDKDKIIVANLDIECESENGFPEPALAQERITSIAIKIKERYYVFGYDFPFDTKGRTDVFYIPSPDEETLLTKFLSLWNKVSPDIVTGWFIASFDMPYLDKRIENVLGTQGSILMSPWGMKTHRTLRRKERVLELEEPMGVSVLDYFDLYKKFAPNPNQASDSLNYISEVELGEQKLDYSEVSSLHELYKTDYQKYVEYNIRDVELVHKIDQKLALMDVALGLAYDARVNYLDCLSQVRMWENIIYGKFLETKHVVPRSQKNFSEGYAGAHVKIPVAGMYNWVASFDLNSLYPHIIRQWNISPETITGNKYSYEMRDLIERSSVIDLHVDETLAANGYTFRTDIEGFLPKILMEMYTERKKFKDLQIEKEKLLQEIDKEIDLLGSNQELLDKRKKTKSDAVQYKILQNTKKVQLNSAYGACGNKHFRFFDIRLAEGITLCGQYVIQTLEYELNNFLSEKFGKADYVIASDTDSLYLNLNAFTNTIDKKPDEEMVDDIDEYCNTVLQDQINKTCQSIYEYLNCFENKMVMKRENIASRGIWTAKKKYILNVWDSEGVRYKECQLKIVGIESVRSSTPQVCREKIKKTIYLIMNASEEDVIDFIFEFRKEFSELPPEEVATPKGMNKLAKYYQASGFAPKCPIQVKSAIIYNRLLEKHDLLKKYEYIAEGTKGKFTYLKVPNPIGEKVIGFPYSLPKEFNLHSYIDYDKQFDTGYLNPIKKILTAIGWEHEKKNNIVQFLEFE